MQNWTNHSHIYTSLNNTHMSDRYMSLNVILKPLRINQNNQYQHSLLCITRVVRMEQMKL